MYSLHVIMPPSPKGTHLVGPVFRYADTEKNTTREASPIMPKMFLNCSPQERLPSCKGHFSLQKGWHYQRQTTYRQYPINVLFINPSHFHLFLFNKSVFIVINKEICSYFLFYINHAYDSLMSYIVYSLLKVIVKMVHFDWQ